MNYRFQTDDNCTVLHTKFNVASDDILNIEGVAWANSIDKYSIRFRIGELFTLEQVKANIKKMFQERFFSVGGELKGNHTDLMHVD